MTDSLEQYDTESQAGISGSVTAPQGVDQQDPPAPDHNHDPRIREIETRKDAFEVVLTPDGPVFKEG